MSISYQQARIEALEMELEATRLAYLEELESVISTGLAQELLVEAVDRIKIELINKKEDGETSI